MSTPFHEVPGPSRLASSQTSPLYYLKLFFTAQIFQMMMTQTNLYRQPCQFAKPSTAPWTDVTVEEIMAFMGVVIAMGNTQLPEVFDYWRTEPILSMPWYSSIFSRTRFLLISRYLHLADNKMKPDRGQPGYKLFKLGGIPELLCRTFKSLYVPTRNLSIDEQMIGTKSRVSFIQYMPKKPKKFGVKIWALCESLTGYCLQFQTYTGKSDTGSVEHGLAYRVVFDLLEEYLDKGYFVYFDNYYTSLKLLQDLALRNTLACGTIRIYRGHFPGNFKSAKLETGDPMFIKNNDILAVHWKDKWDVFAMSSIHGNTTELVERRGENNNITKPSMIIEYNKYMNGVDKCDQYLTYYSLGSK